MDQVKEIVMRIPWQCDLIDCYAVWHISTYWSDQSSSTGYTCDELSDGDCEEVDELPSWDDFDKAMKAYAEAVVEANGADPLWQFLGKTGVERMKIAKELIDGDEVKRPTSEEFTEQAFVLPFND